VGIGTMPGANARGIGGAGKPANVGVGFQPTSGLVSNLSMSVFIPLQPKHGIYVKGVVRPRTPHLNLTVGRSPAPHLSE
jgi:hypothetical protein